MLSDSHNFFGEFGHPVFSLMRIRRSEVKDQVSDTNIGVGLYILLHIFG